MPGTLDPSDLPDASTSDPSLGSGVLVDRSLSLMESPFCAIATSLHAKKNSSLSSCPLGASTSERDQIDRRSLVSSPEDPRKATAAPGARNPPFVSASVQSMSYFTTSEALSPSLRAICGTASPSFAPLAAIPLPVTLNLGSCVLVDRSAPSRTIPACAIATSLHATKNSSLLSCPRGASSSDRDQMSRSAALSSPDVPRNATAAPAASSPPFVSAPAQSLSYAVTSDSLSPNFLAAEDGAIDPTCGRGVLRVRSSSNDSPA
mmetsp:Transcript_12972/g.33203  ORF Transcript_12972/g.33203 Transcript_12972/m.33203 type:complete len:262 (-) Transcript_12972:940-1725(-)